MPDPRPRRFPLTTLSLSLAAVASLALASCGPRRPPRKGAKLASPEVSAGIARLDEGIHACHEQHKLGGYAQVMLRIETGGRVSSVELGKRFGGTPAGRCLRRLFLEQGRFEIDQGPVIVRYPVLVR